MNQKKPTSPKSQRNTVGITWQAKNNKQNPWSQRIKKKSQRIIKIKNGQSIGITWHHLTWQAKIQPKQRVARDQQKKIPKNY